MTRPTIHDGGIDREMTNAEFDQWQKDIEEQAANVETIKNAQTARKSAIGKLEALGLTAAEIAALVG